MSLKNALASTLIVAALIGTAQANTITQVFASDWTISTWDYYGDVAALQWHYIPYSTWDSSLGTLNKVAITTSIEGVKDASDSVSIRYAFFTGWNPDQYQFYGENQFSAGSTTFSATLSKTSGTDFALSNFQNYLYLPQANYYFESRSTVTHSIHANTALVYDYIPISSVPEPESYGMLMAGLILVGCRIRRRITAKV